MSELSDSKVDADRSKTWSDEEVLQLIKYYEDFAQLWDSKHPYYRNKDQKAKALEEISRHFDCSSQEIQRKLHNLRNQVNQEMNKIKIRRSKGGTEKSCTSSWKYFSALQFILPSIHTKSPQPNLGQNVCETQLVIVDNIPEDDSKFQIINNDSRVIVDNIPEDSKFQIINNDSRVIEQKFNLRRNISDDEDSLPDEKVVVKRRKDDIELFGEYVASELRSLRSDYYRRKLKSEIRKAVVRIADEEDSMY